MKRTQKTSPVPLWSAGIDRALDALERLRPARQAAIIFIFALVILGAGLAASPLLGTPVGLFFVGDSLLFVEQARRLVEGLPQLDSGLPFHSPLIGWLLVPFWWWFGDLAAVALAFKCAWIALAGAGYALAFLWARDRLPHAFWIALLLPLSFGEIALSSAAGGELVYRLLLLVQLTLGWRRPALAGLLNGLAALVRPEHLPLALGVAAVIAWRRPERRPFLAWALGGFVLVLVPYAALLGSTVAAYNRAHTTELQRPLPVLAPVSFYGPLNFALAHREEGIHFSRRTLPPPPGRPTALDPTFPPHNEAIVDGYALGWRAIASDPARFVVRSAAKVAHSATALAHGWTWRDLPKPGIWVRQPVDVASASSPWFTALCLALFALGAWRLKAERAILFVGCGLLLVRLLVNVAFFPYLRSVMILTPFLLAVLLIGLAALAGRFGRSVLVGLLVVLTAIHLATVWSGSRGYRLAGEYSEEGALIDDRPVVIERVTR